MSTNDTFLAVFLGSKTSAKMAAWNALPEAERRGKEQQGIAAWKAQSPVGRSLFTAQELRDVGIRLMQKSKSAHSRNAWAGVLPSRAN